MVWLVLLALLDFVLHHSRILVRSLFRVLDTCHVLIKVRLATNMQASLMHVIDVMFSR